MRGKHSLQIGAPLLLLFLCVSVAGFGYEGDFAAAFGGFVSSLLYSGPPLICWALIALHKSRRHPLWKAAAWLPLRGRWLCYFVWWLVLLLTILLVCVTGSTSLTGR